MSVLATIARERAEAIARAARAEPLAAVRRQAASAPPPRDFAAALQARLDAGKTAAIAEIKFASPSAGAIRTGSADEAIRIARDYAEAGAACLSVLTEPDRFAGSFEYLAAVRDNCELPILCKDFIVSPWQLYKARACGADAALLIVAMLPGSELLKLADQARQTGLALLTEIHTAEELDWVLRQPLLAETLIGINNRDLKTLQTSLSIGEELAERIPQGRLCVAESGIESRADLDRLANKGIQAALVGEALMRARDPGRKLAELLTG